MTSRERVLTVLAHKEADRVPIDLGGFQSEMCVIALENLCTHLGLEFPVRILERVQQLAVIPVDILQRFHIDTRYVFPGDAAVVEIPEENAFRNEWGIVWAKKDGVFYFEMVEHPLADINDVESLKKYPFPTDINRARMKGIKDTARAFRDSGFAVFTSISSINETAWYMRGLDNFLMDMVTNKKYFVMLYEKVLESMMEIYGAFLDEVGEYLDVIQIWGDMTGQNGPLYSPEFYREYMKPRDFEQIKFLKSKTDARIAWHCCGAAVHFIPDLIDLGVEILNPIQVSARGMDTKRLKTEYGKDLCFWGGIDTQHVLPYGSTQEVEQEVKRRIDDLAPGGGYILSSVHNIQPDVPPENIVTMYETAFDYGRLKSNK
jgi:uroporphyrinogen decarboxylase